MGLRLLFSRREVNEFAKDLAANLAKRYPPALDVSPERRVSEHRLTKILEDVLSQGTEFQRQHRLGLFGKAKLGNEFRWQLKELGYTDRFIELATEGLMVYIIRARAPASAGPDKA